MKDTYRTIETETEGLFKDRGSRFISFAFPVEDEKQVKDIISTIRKKHNTARHHCYAWRLGVEEITYRMNDDGEPSSTAGRPIYGQLLSHDLTNVLIVVVRYFGGTLLGTSGLINAYKSASQDAIAKAIIVEKQIEKKYLLTFGYELMNPVMNLLKNENAAIEKIESLENCKLHISVGKSECERLEKQLDTIFGLTYYRQQMPV